MNSGGELVEERGAEDGVRIAIAPRLKSEGHRAQKTHHSSLPPPPRKRTKHSWPAQELSKDDASEEPYLTALRPFEAGLPHTVRHVDRPGSEPLKKEVAEGVPTRRRRSRSPSTLCATPGVHERVGQALA